MSITRNRELSQFGSFIHIDDNTQSIGITTEAIPFVGIGTTNPSVKLEVIGDTNISGNLNIGGAIAIGTDANIGGDVSIGGDVNIDGNIEAQSYTFNGIPFLNPQLQHWTNKEQNLYRLQGNVSIGSSLTFDQKLNVNGNISAGQYISTVASGTAPLVVLSNTQVTNLNASFLRSKVPPNGEIVGTTDTQTLTNKTLTSPTLTSPTINSITFNGQTSGTTVLQPLATAGGSLFLPNVGGTLVSTNSVGVVTSRNIADGTIVNEDISPSAAIAVSKLASNTISGITLGNELNFLSFGPYFSSVSYNGRASVNVSIAATTVNIANTLVARDINGDFTAGTITATDFNSTSDSRVKENISTFENGLETIKKLRGVNYSLKENNKKSIGVIAQELEEILPELVKDEEIKSVNYNGLIGVLIEAVKELSKEVEELKRTK